MANTPKYVRLTPRLSRNVICDVQGSGWSISGLDVKPFPEGDTEKDKAAKKFVRRQIQAGNLEPCSKAEYDDVQEQARSIPQPPSVAGAPFQEAQFQRAVEEATRRVEESREAAIAAGADGPSGEADDADDDDDDDEVEEKATKKSSSKKAAAKSKGK